MYLKRGETTQNISVAPILCAETKRYRIGLFVRDSAAGVGTLTFYDPKSKTYGALGHVITDNDTSQPIDCNQGKIVLAKVSGIQQGRRGDNQGKKSAYLLMMTKYWEILVKIHSLEFMESFQHLPQQQLFPEGIPVASMSQVQLGPAEMLTVVDGQTIESFAIEIEKINLQEAPEGKGLVIRVTDQRLLELTGGIVQGMSGSPILQNGKLIGAVTHVFVHDPAKGYGCFIDWMLMESGLIPEKHTTTASKLFSLQGRFLLPVA